jgi:tRNA(Ile)-lysidine synthase
MQLLNKALFDSLEVFLSKLNSSSNFKIAIALSGGADSFCLLLSCQSFLLRFFPSVQLLAVTVDHRLRVESTTEALYVQEICKQLNIAHTILIWEHGVIQSAFQEKARQARYDLLSEFCLQHHIQLLLTGHHANDQVETFLMRLKRGSSPRGLICMKTMTKMSFGYLIRPFLSVENHILREYVTKYAEINGLEKFFWIEDPSNQNTKFERVQIREYWGELKKIGLEAPSVLKTIKHLKESEDYIAHELEKLEAHCVEKSMETTVIDLDRFKSSFPYLAKRLLQRILESLNPKPCSLDLISCTYNKIISSDFKATTAHGFLIRRFKKKIIITKEKKDQKLSSG